MKEKTNLERITEMFEYIYETYDMKVFQVTEFESKFGEGSYREIVFYGVKKDGISYIQSKNHNMWLTTDGVRHLFELTKLKQESQRQLNQDEINRKQMNINIYLLLMSLVTSFGVVWEISRELFKDSIKVWTGMVLLVGICLLIIMVGNELNKMLNPSR